jgi:hypothetical protein
MRLSDSDPSFFKSPTLDPQNVKPEILRIRREDGPAFVLARSKVLSELCADTGIG